MPGKWEYRGHWLDDNVAGNGIFYAYWYERKHVGAGRKRTPRRKSLKTKDIEEARDRLVEHVLKADTVSTSSLITSVLEKYADEILQIRPKGTREAGLWAVKLITEEMEGTEAIAALTEEFQEHLMRSWRQKHHHAATTISRNLTVLSAAIGHARIKDAPKIFYGANYISRRLNIPGGQRRWFPTDDDAFARFIDALGSDAAFHWTIIAMNTLCRPEAALDLGPAQIDLANGLVKLNPDDRAQNDKYRPVVRLTENLASWSEAIPAGYQDVKSNAERGLLEREEPWKLRPRYVPYRSIDSLQSAYTRARKAVELPQMVPHSIRHKMTTVLRSKGVLEDHVSMQLGHTKTEHRTTRLYGEFDPAYLMDCANAIDEYIFELDKRTDRDLFAKSCCKTVANDKIVQISSHREN